MVSLKESVRENYWVKSHSDFEQLQNQTNHDIDEWVKGYISELEQCINDGSPTKRGEGKFYIAESVGYNNARDRVLRFLRGN